MLTGNESAAFECALFGKTAGTFKEKLIAFTAANSAN
jgi:hypothetical protein